MRVDRLLGELNKWLIPLAVNNLLVHLKNVDAAIHDINMLICAATHRKDTPEHLQEIGVGARGVGGTTTMGSVSRSHI
jgi:tartrate dehydratase alpha subunit/fumarate hydratase class I-like protein